MYIFVPVSSVILYLHWITNRSLYTPITSSLSNFTWHHLGNVLTEVMKGHPSGKRYTKKNWDGHFSTRVENLDPPKALNVTTPFSVWTSYPHEIRDPSAMKFGYDCFENFMGRIFLVTLGSDLIDRHSFFELWEISFCCFRTKCRYILDITGRILDSFIFS